MSSLPKQQSSSTFKQPPFRTNTTNTNSTASTPIASSRPRPIEQLSDNKPRDAEYRQISDNDQALPVEPIEGPVEGEEDEAENPSQPSNNFKPFFTLIEDANFSDYHHPTVHYIFSDDDTEIITEASLRVLESGHASSPLPQNSQHESGDRSNEGASHRINLQSQSLDRPSLLPPPLPGVKERFIVLDVEQNATTTTTGGLGGPSSAPDALAGTSAGTATTIVSGSPAQKQTVNAPAPYGYHIVSAHSLTPDWQVLDASLSLAPTFDTPQQQTASDQASMGNTLMLRIEGTSGYPRDVTVGGKDKESTTKEQTLEEMMEQFDKRMSELRRVIESSGDYAPLGATAIAGPEHDDQDGNAEITASSSPAPATEDKVTQGMDEPIASIEPEQGV